MIPILFVCQANVGRSQMAEAFFNFHSGKKAARSAGVEDFREKYQHHPTAEIIEAMREKGIDISQQRIDFLTSEMCDEAATIVVLCSRALCPTFLLQNKRVIFREIEDPHEQSPDRVCQIRDQVERVVLECLNDMELRLTGIVPERKTKRDRRNWHNQVT